MFPISIVLFIYSYFDDLIDNGNPFEKLRRKDTDQRGINYDGRVA